MTYPDPYGQPYGGYGQPGPPYPGGYPVAAPEEPNATTAMVLGIVSLLCCGPLGIAAVLVGRKSKRAIEASGNTLGGAGKASAGEICGWIALALLGIGLLLSLIAMFLFGVSLVALLSGMAEVSSTSGGYPN